MRLRKNTLNHGLMLGWERPEGKRGLPKPIRDDGDEGHLLTIAPTGAGKGVSCVIPALLSWAGPCIVIDPKGENYAVTAAHRRSVLGQEVFVMDPFHITDAEDYDSLNPLDLIINPVTMDDEGAVITAMLVQWVTHKHDIYWDERASELISQAIQHVMTERSAPNRTLGEVRRLVEGYTDSCDENLHGLACIGDFMPTGMSSHRTRSSIASTACSHMSFLFNGGVQDSVGPSTLQLDDIRHGRPITVYLVLPPDRLKSHSKLLRLWLAVMLKAIARRVYVPPVPTLMLVDEAAQLGDMEELRSALTLMRGYGVRLWTFWQDLSQLRRVYPNDWESLLTNSSTQQIFGLGNPHVMRQMADYLGPLLNRPLTSLKPDEMVLIRPGAAPAFVRRPDYRRDAAFAGLAADNPFHLPPRDLFSWQVAPANDHDTDNVVPFERGER